MAVLGCQHMAAAARSATSSTAAQQRCIGPCHSFRCCLISLPDRPLVALSTLPEFMCIPAAELQQVLGTGDRAFTALSAMLDCIGSHQLHVAVGCTCLSQHQR